MPAQNNLTDDELRRRQWIPDGDAGYVERQPSIYDFYGDTGRSDEFLNTVLPSD